MKNSNNTKILDTSENSEISISISIPQLKLQAIYKFKPLLKTTVSNKISNDDDK